MMKDIPEWLQLLAQKYTLIAGAAARSQFDYLDSFDDRLFQAGMTLTDDGHILRLCQADVPGYLTTAVEKRPSFIWDLPEGDLKEPLSLVLGVRRLLVQANVSTSTTPYAAANEAGEVLLRFHLKETRPSAHMDAPVLTTLCQLNPETGHEVAAQQLLEEIEAAGGTAVTAADLYLQVMTAVGKQPGVYKAKPSLQLTPTLPAAEAVQQLLRADFEVMQINEPYIAQDLDSEFLHDYRVALRRSRVLLAQLKAVFPAEETAAHKLALKEIFQLSNPLRDIDVYLLAEDHYRALLPAAMQPDIDPMFAYLREKRTAVYQETVATLQTQAYQQAMAAWQTFLLAVNEPNPSAFNARRPIKSLACETIFYRYGIVLADGRQILANADETQMHNLRLECKKMRYLMEYFVSLFPAEEIEALILQLKILQTNLGIYNDLRIQESYLQHMAEAGVLPGVEDRVLNALQTLRQALHTERLAVGAEFADTFQQFAAPENQQLFGALLAPGISHSRRAI